MQQLAESLKFLWAPMVGVLSATLTVGYFSGEINERLSDLDKEQKRTAPYVRQNSDQIVVLKEMQSNTLKSLEKVEDYVKEIRNDFKQSVQIIQQEQKQNYKELMKSIHGIRE